MISFIIGQIDRKSEGEIIVESNNIGYQIAVSNSTLASLPVVGETVKIFTYMVVKEDGISLIGFSTIEEKEMFLKLISVSGVGPKLALAVLSGISVSALIKAIAKEDIASLSSVKGVGKKTCERIIVELKDKFSLSDVVGLENDCNNEIAIPESVIEEVVGVLTGLGMNKNDALKLAKSVASEKDTAETLLPKAIQNIGR